MKVIWGLRQAKCFSQEDWTTQISLIWFSKLSFARADDWAAPSCPMGRAMASKRYSPVVARLEEAWGCPQVVVARLDRAIQYSPSFAAMSTGALLGSTYAQHHTASLTGSPGQAGRRH
jgi:hypothetical protein